jgi:hypothetical protein
MDAIENTSWASLIQNPKCSKIRSFLSNDTVPQVETPADDFMWWVTVKTQAHYKYCIKLLSAYV